jgi:hypothetical protein
MVEEGVESENYFTALAGDEVGEVSGKATADGAEESAGGQSEAPSIKSPHKARAGGTNNIRQRAAEGSNIKTTKRKGSKVMGLATTDPKATTTESSRRTAERRVGAMEGTEDTGAPDSVRIGHTTSKSKRKA